MHLAKAAADYAAPDYGESRPCSPQPPGGQAPRWNFLFEVGYADDDEFEEDPEVAIQREFLKAAEQLSADELREFVEDHVSGELKAIRRLPAEQRSQAFRSLCAEWHPDKCPAIAGLATEIFQRLQTQKSTVLQSP